MASGGDRGSGGRKSGRSDAKGKAAPSFDPAPSGAFAAKLLGRARVATAVIGRLAVWHWIPNPSEHEFTKDLDFAIAREDMPRLLAELNRTGVHQASLSIGGVNAYDDASHINVDFIDRASSEWGDLSGLFNEAIARAPDSLRIGAAVFPVVSPEHLVAMKLATGAGKDERDVERLLEWVVGLDIELVRDLIRRHMGALFLGRFEEILRRVGHPLAKRSYKPGIDAAWKAAKTPTAAPRAAKPRVRKAPKRK